MARMTAPNTETTVQQLAADAGEASDVDVCERGEETTRQYDRLHSTKHCAKRWRIHLPRPLPTTGRAIDIIALCEFERVVIRTVDGLHCDDDDDEEEEAQAIFDACARSTLNGEAPASPQSNIHENLATTNFAFFSSLNPERVFVAAACLTCTISGGAAKKNRSKSSNARNCSATHHPSFLETIIPSSASVILL